MEQYSLKRHFLWAWDLTRGRRAYLWVYFVLELFSVALSLMFIYWSKKAIDVSLSDADEKLIKPIVLVISTALLGVLTGLLSSWVNEKNRVVMLIRLQSSLVNRQMTSTWNHVKEWKTGDLLVRLNTDCQEIVQMIATSGLNILITIVKLISALLFLWFMDPILALMLIAISPLFLFSKLYFKRVRQLNKDAKSAESELGNVQQESLKLRMLVRGLGLTQIRKKKLRDTQQSIFRLKMQQVRFGLFTQGILRLTMNIGYLLAFVWGIYQLHYGLITFGTVTAFLQLVNRVQPPLISMMSFLPMFIRFRVSLDRVLKMEDIENEDELINQEVLEDIKSLQIDDLSFQYEQETIVRNLNVKVRVGESLAVIGSSGKGKTTLIRLLLSLIQPTSGNILIETNTAVVPLEAKHRVNFSYVPQGNTLFSGTIRDNLILDGGNNDERTIQSAIQIACAEFVYSLPQSLDTVIGESGLGLSEGQAQRIAIARSLTKKSKIWLFDEATSALDEATSERLLQYLLYEGKDKIIIFVTHDLRLASKCSKTFYIN